MYIKKVNITNFRNYKKISVSFNKGINIIYGDNGQGKTNLLESIYFLGLTKSHRSFIDNNLIMEGKTHSNISGLFINNKIKQEFEINLNQSLKKIKINKYEIKKISDYISKIKIIIFFPEDLELIKGYPSVRRRFLNIEISQFDPSYIKIISDYKKILKMRNDYLKKYKNKLVNDSNYFDILNNYFVDKMIDVYKCRYDYVEKINKKIVDIYKEISGLDNLKLNYKNSITDTIPTKEQIYEKLKKIRSSEEKQGISLIGPHKDDFEINFGNKNLKFFGSQGQQRLAILALKLSEVLLMKENNYIPIILLDDVFSELDSSKKNNLLSYIINDNQVIITTTDLDNIDKKILSKSKLIRIENGKIKNLKGKEENE